MRRTRQTAYAIVLSFRFDRLTVGDGNLTPTVRNFEYFFRCPVLVGSTTYVEPRVQCVIEKNKSLTFFNTIALRGRNTRCTRRIGQFNGDLNTGDRSIVVHFRTTAVFPNDLLECTVRKPLRFQRQVPVFERSKIKSHGRVYSISNFCTFMHNTSDFYRFIARSGVTRSSESQTICNV